MRMRYSDKEWVVVEVRSLGTLLYASLKDEIHKTTRVQERCQGPLALIY